MPDVKLDKGLRGSRAISFMRVVSKFYAAVLVGLLRDDKEPTEWIDYEWQKIVRMNEYQGSLATRSVCGQSEREDGVRCCQALCGISNF